MQGTTRGWAKQSGWLLHGVAVVALLGLALLGQAPGEVLGWVLPVGWPAAGRLRRDGVRRRSGWAWWARLRAVGGYLAVSWPPAVLRSLLLWRLWVGSGGWGPAWLWLAPWGLWFWRGLAVGWPRLRQWGLWRWVEWGLWQAQRLLLVGYVGLALCHGRGAGASWSGLVGLTAGGTATAEPWVQVSRQADGRYQAELVGHFTLTVADDHPFRMRLLVLFLSLLDAPGASRGSRRTRDGRTPVVRQQGLAQALGVTQPEISRWLGYWQAGRWADLLSLHSAEVLTAELVAQIVTVWATFPTWSKPKSISTCANRVSR